MCLMTEKGRQTQHTLIFHWGKKWRTDLSLLVTDPLVILFYSPLFFLDRQYLYFGFQMSEFIRCLARESRRTNGKL